MPLLVSCLEASFTKNASEESTTGNAWTSCCSVCNPSVAWWICRNTTVAGPTTHPSNASEMMVLGETKVAGPARDDMDLAL